MGLVDDQQAERRRRILKAARAHVARHGYDGLTMRDLAQAAKVSVPTLYNLFGGKDAILSAALVESVERIAGIQPPAGTTYFGRAMLGFEAGMAMVADAPDFYRRLIPLFMTSPEARPIRHRTEAGFVALMTGNLSAARDDGQLAAWAEPRTVACHMWAQYMAAFLTWGIGETDLDGFRTLALSGICHVLAAVTRGPFADEVGACLERVAPAMRALTLPQPMEAAHVRSAD